MEKLAIIGTGIAGMGAAHLLYKKYDLTIFEKNDYTGGHTNTVTVKEGEKDVYIDTGFMVFNKVTYPNLNRLFELLKVPVMKTSMSFSVTHVESGLEYSGSGLKGLFSQRKRIFDLSYIRMLWQINRFNNECLEVLDNPFYSNYSLADYVKAKKYGNDFLFKYLIPMSSAVWSTPPDLMLNFPARTLIRFFYNHGFLGLNTQHQWYTVVNGSKTYRDLLIEPFKDRIRTGSRVRQVWREAGKIKILLLDNSVHYFDKVIFASHADETLSMLSDATSLEKKLLSPFKYQYNKATLHTDSSVMPKTKRAWSSWNYRIQNAGGAVKTSIIYYMNSLQNVSDNKDYFVSIDDPGNIGKEHIIKEIDYHHPLFDIEAVKAQDYLMDLNKQGNNTYFCGSYFKYGFHEDAYTSAVNLGNLLLQEKK